MGGTGEMRAASLEYSNTVFAGAAVYWLPSTLTGVVRGVGREGRFRRSEEERPAGKCIAYRDH
jgi:hypothetical protein